MYHSKLCAYNNIDINYPHEKILIGNGAIEWWGYVLCGSQILSFQISVYLYEHEFQERANLTL